MVNGIHEFRIDPPAAKPACRCVLRDMSRDVENIIESAMIVAGIEWKGRMGHSITDDLETLLDSYYTFSTCPECAPDKESKRCKFIGMGEK